MAFMTYVPELKLVYYADKGSNILKVCIINNRNTIFVSGDLANVLKAYTCIYLRVSIPCF